MLSPFWRPRLGIGAEAGAPTYSAQALEAVQENHFGGVPIGVDRNSAQLEIPQLLQVLNTDVIGPRFSAYPHAVMQILVEAGSCSVEDDINRVAVRYSGHVMVITDDILLAD